MKEVLLAWRSPVATARRRFWSGTLNTNFYGNLAYGIEAAAQVYFGKHARDLNLAEAATLAAIPSSPN